MKIGKKLLAQYEPYGDEFAWEDFLYEVGELVKKRFARGYVKCEATNLGWRHLSGFKVFSYDSDQDNTEAARSFLHQFTPDCAWSADVYSLNEGKGLYFRVSHHDAPTGESYYLMPIAQSTYERLKFN